jgi:hypothetical protein
MLAVVCHVSRSLCGASPDGPRLQLCAARTWVADVSHVSLVTLEPSMHSFRCVEEPLIAAAHRQVGSAKHAGQDTVSNSSAGRLKGNPSTIVNLRLPFTLLTKLDRYLDRLEVER